MNPLAAIWNVTGLGRSHIISFGVPMIGFTIGAYFDFIESNRMVMFRDKSALYGRQLNDGEAPSWPVTYLQ